MFDFPLKTKKFKTLLFKKIPQVLKMLAIY